MYPVRYFKVFFSFMNEINLYLVVVLCQFQHFFDNSFIELAVLTVVLQGEAFHPALLMQVQQHLWVIKSQFNIGSSQ